jgi:hypothetical protein
MNRYQAEQAWKKINRYNLLLAVRAMLECDVRTSSSPIDNGKRGMVNIQFTKDPDYMKESGDHFARLESLGVLFKDIAPKGRFSIKGFSASEAQYNINVTYKLPLFSARFATVAEPEFLTRMALFDLAFLFGQAVESYQYRTDLLAKFPDPRHKWERVVRSRLPFLDNAARINVPRRPEDERLRNSQYFD